jgi:hypothetical protein
MIQSMNSKGWVLGKAVKLPEIIPDLDTLQSCRMSTWQKCGMRQLVPCQPHTQCTLDREYSCSQTACTRLQERMRTDSRIQYEPNTLTAGRRCFAGCCIVRGQVLVSVC